MPLIVDADGLFWMATEGRSVSETVIVSPHVGEAASLLGVDSNLIELDRIESAKKIRTKFRAIGVVKGPGSVVFGREKISICEHGNPGMAAAGMGDVLSGIIGGFVAQKAVDIDACLEIAVLLHSAAADEAANELGQRSLMATDVIKFLPKVLQGE
jgi:NAD(P)H-hydrate epimerase